MKNLMYIMAFAAVGGVMGEGEVEVDSNDTSENNDITNIEINEIEFREDYPVEEGSIWGDYLNDIEEPISQEQEIFEV